VPLRVRAGEFRDYADMARTMGFTRARITQIMDLLPSAPDIQEEILDLEASGLDRQLTGADLRWVAGPVEWRGQRCRLATLKRRIAR
jgi:hypothetical protein